jgi:tetratricopeptide (TPR) repeat protein
MSLVDPVSKAQFSPSVLSKTGWIASVLARIEVGKARKAARRADWTVACDAYFKSLRLTPANGSRWVQLGHALGNLGKVDSSHIAYANAIWVQPRLSTGHKHLGLVRFNTSLHEQAVHSLACALFLDPQDTKLRDFLLEEGNGDEAWLEARMGIAARAIADRRSSPGYIGLRATVLRTKARAASRRRHWPEAERFYRRLARMRPHDADILIQLGHTMNEQNRQKDAENVYRRAVTAAPLSPDAWLHLGYVLTAQKQHLKAREAFAMVNRLAPSRRAEHPILESADTVLQLDISGNSHNRLDVSGNFPGRRLTCPDGMPSREKSIWLRLASNIESRI